MSKRREFCVLALASMLVLAGCATGSNPAEPDGTSSSATGSNSDTTGTSSESSGDASGQTSPSMAPVDPPSSSLVPAPKVSDFDTLLPPNSIGGGPILRAEGAFSNKGWVSASTANAQAAAEWTAQFACDATGSVLGRIMLDGEPVGGEIAVTCGVGNTVSQSFSGEGIIEVQIKGDGEGIFVMQVVRNEAA